MRLAFDCGVPKAAIEAAEQAGHEVVYWAGSEHDQWWFREAMELGADVFVSPDWDIAILANQNDKGFIKLPQALARGRLINYIMSRVAVAMKAYRTSGRYPEIIK